MATIKPFAALRPRSDVAALVCELPYDVMSSDEARQIAADKPLSFLHVSKPEIDLPPETRPYDDAVYRQGRENFRELIEQDILAQEAAPAFYLYRQVMGDHAQVGIVAVASVAEYDAGLIKKHELTRVDKEDDRVRHIEVLGAQTGPVFLTYRARPDVDRLVADWMRAEPDIDFTATDGVRHSAWPVRGNSEVDRLQQAFSQVPALYIADGHHRSAAASRVSRALGGTGHAAWFLAVIFPHNQMRIMPYNRVLRDLNGAAEAELLKRLEAVFTIEPNGKPAPARKHELGFYLAGQWRTLVFKAELLSERDAIGRLDVTLLQRHVLAPLFGIEDPRTSNRIGFVGGIRGTKELERSVDDGAWKCAFSMFPTGIEDLMEIADGGGIMPPKSTWFEPKLRDAMFCHVL